MISNYFTLLHTANLLHQRYARTVIAEIYSQDKNTLSIVLYTPEPHTITISCTARENYIVARSGDFRQRKNSVGLFPELIDKHIESVYISAADRTIYMKISGNQWLCTDMFASKSNVMLCDDRGTIIDAFLNKKELISTKRELQKDEQIITIEHILPPRDRFPTEEFGNDDFLKLLKKAVPKLGTTLANETLFRCSSTVNEKSKISSLDSRVRGNDNDLIFSITNHIVKELLSLKDISPVIYFDEQSPVCFSLLPLTYLSSYRMEQYDDIFIGTQKFISFERSTSSFIQKKKEIVGWLTKELEKAVRTIRAVESELSESSRAEQYQLFANLLTANLHLVTKGMKSVSLENSYIENEKVVIPLDVSLSPQKNAGRFYDKAKKSKTAKEESQLHLTTLKKRESILKDLLEKSNGINESVSWKNYLHSYGGVVKELGYMTEKEHKELPPFKIFSVEGGFLVYAGKNSANNDLLTFKFAKPNDLWFHARGSSGSHVVLKLGGSQGTPSKKAIEQAAAIAAYYSKMKNAKHVPVAMTERKFVHKPKGAPAGTVALDREKVIFVKPLLPNNEA
ncbi:MAG: NFACT RNA binding domain-containing protein [Bacteroidota bacterium]|nr:NFACT RNA binding domain-containing protein [Bacteroidota bacterium]